MDVSQNFRSAFRGFNRDDVVHYIEYLNSLHTTQTNQLKGEIESLQEELRQVRETPVPAPDPVPAAQDSTLLDDANARCLSLEQERNDMADALRQVQARLDQLSAKQLAVTSNTNLQELEAYRRAERVERLATERADHIYEQANGVLADATSQMEEASTMFDGIANQVSLEINRLTQQITTQMTQLQKSVSDSKQLLQNAAATMCNLRPDTDK